jgi:hypothetical protein
MSNLATILALVNQVDSQTDLRLISNALGSRWKVLQGAVAQKAIQEKSILPGDPVSFTHAGKKHYGVVKTINQKTCSVDVPSGIPGIPRNWRVSPQLLTKEASLPAPPAKRTEEDLMNEILDCYAGLSPENLSCDGEASRAHMMKRSRELNDRLNVAFKELGYRVTETAAYAWHSTRKAIQKVG